MKYQLIKERDPLLSPIEQIFYNRGISLQEIQNFINPTENSLVTPLKFDNILEGFKILLKHIKNWDKTYLQVDCDADGMTSAAILINYLHRRFPIWIDNCLSYHFHKGKEHGIELNEVSDDIKLVIAPDASSNEFDIHKQLYDRGVDVLILDHHKAEEVSQWACVINNQLCDYPNKTLSGAGVVYKFCAFMDNYFEVPYAQDFLDLASLGIIADVMNLTNLETRYIISKGLSNIQNPFFKEMVHMQSYNLQDGVTPSGVGWYISPYINAMMRSGTQEEKKLMFEAMLESKAYTNIPSTKRGASIGEEELLVEQAVRVASRVKDRQNKERDKFYKEVAQTIADENLNKDIAEKVKAFNRLHPEKIVEHNRLLAQRPEIIQMNKELAEEMWLRMPDVREEMSKFRRDNPELSSMDFYDAFWKAHPEYKLLMSKIRKEIGAQRRQAKHADTL